MSQPAILSIPQNFVDLRARPFDLRDDIRIWCKRFLGNYHVRLLPVARPEKYSFTYNYRRNSESMLCKTIIAFQNERDVLAFQLRWMP